MYKCTAFYSKPDERSILYSDKDLSIDWMTEKEIVSEKDKMSVGFNEIDKDFFYKHN